MLTCFVLSLGFREENKRLEEETESEKEEDDDSEEEMETGITRPEQRSQGAQEEGSAPALTKAEVRELRRIRRMDYSWLTGLLDP